jgi:hypothetical protein
LPCSVNVDNGVDFDVDVDVEKIRDPKSIKLREQPSYQHAGEFEALLIVQAVSLKSTSNDKPTSPNNPKIIIMSGAGYDVVVDVDEEVLYAAPFANSQAHLTQSTGRPWTYRLARRPRIPLL